MLQMYRPSAFNFKTTFAELELSSSLAERLLFFPPAAAFSLLSKEQSDPNKDPKVNYVLFRPK